MNMQKIPIGLIIREIVKKKNVSVSRLADELGISRQAIYNTYTRTAMHEGDIERWAKALGVDESELLRQEELNTTRENLSFGEETIESIVKMMENELREKNEQIRSLQRALHDAQRMNQELLGKSEGVVMADLSVGSSSFFLPPAHKFANT